jgi:hypothetical protein
MPHDAADVQYHYDSILVMGNRLVTLLKYHYKLIIEQEHFATTITKFADLWDQCELASFGWQGLR